MFIIRLKVQTGIEVKQTIYIQQNCGRAEIYLVARRNDSEFTKRRQLQKAIAAKIIATKEIHTQ